jgi:hypothetical protein
MEESGNYGETIPPIEVIDIFDDRYKVHYLAEQYLQKVFQRGLYTSKFAQRIGDVEHPSNSDRFPMSGVWVSSKVNVVYRKQQPITQTVGVIIEGISDSNSITEVPLRIAPRQIVGLVIPDTQVEEDYGVYSIVGKHRLEGSDFKQVTEQIDRIKKVIENTSDQDKKATIYGTSGDLYYPYALTHAEVVNRINPSTK